MDQFIVEFPIHLFFQKYIKFWLKFFYIAMRHIFENVFFFPLIVDESSKSLGEIFYHIFLVPTFVVKITIIIIFFARTVGEVTTSFYFKRRNAWFLRFVILWEHMWYFSGGLSNRSFFDFRVWVFGSGVYLDMAE